MKLIRIRLQNFRAHRDSAVAFADGINGILGPNEAGKSTIATEALLFALYGSPALRGKMDTVKWKGAPAKHRPEVELVLELDGEQLRVVRTDRNAQVFVGADGTPAAAGTSPVNEYLRSRLGLSLDEFAATFLCLQKDLPRIVGMKPTERQQFVREVMGIARIDRALEACRKRKNELARERDGLAAGLGEREPLEQDVATAREERDEADWVAGNAGDAHEDALAAAGDANDALDASAERKAAHDAAERRRVEAEANARAARQESERLTAEFDQAHEARAELLRREAELRPLDGLRAERDRLVAAASTASERATLEETIADADRQIEQYRARIAECDAAVAAFDAAELQRVADRYREAEAEHQRLADVRRARAAAAKAEGDAAETERKRIERRIELLQQQGPDTPCPTCTLAVGDRFASVLDTLREDLRRTDATVSSARELASELADVTDDELALEAELQDLRAEGEELKRRRHVATQAAENRPQWERGLVQEERRLAAARERLATLPSVAPDPERLAAARSEIAELEKLDAGLNPLRSRAGRIDLLNEQRIAADTRWEDALQHSAQAVAAIEASGFSADRHAELAAAAKAAAETLSRAKQALAAAIERQKGAAAALERAERALAAYDARAAQLATLTANVQRHELAAERLDAFRVAAASTLRPEMEELMSGFVSVLTDGRHESVTVTEDFEVVCQEGGVDMEVISGGAEDVVALAQRVAMSQMIAERRGKPLSLLVLDEPFGSLDETRRPAVLDFLRRLSGVFGQVVLISHVEETRLIADHLIQLEHNAAVGCSRVVGAPSTPAAEPALAGAAA